MKTNIQWNTVNPVTNGPQKSGLTDRVVVLKMHFIKVNN